MYRAGDSITHVLRRIIRHPRDKGDLAARALATSGLVLDIKDGIPTAHALLALLVLALGIQQLLPELAVVVVRRGLLNDNLLPVVGDLVNDPLGRLAELELIEGLDALGCDGDSVGDRGQLGRLLSRGKANVVIVPGLRLGESLLATRTISKRTGTGLPCWAM